jgi:hypothetical protein
LMQLAFLGSNDAKHYLPELALFHRQHKELRRVFLIRERVQIFQAKCPILMYAYGRNLSV